MKDEEISKARPCGVEWHPEWSLGMTEQAREAGYDVVVGKVPTGAVGALTSSATGAAS